MGRTLVKIYISESFTLKNTSSRADKKKKVSIYIRHPVYQNNNISLNIYLYIMYYRKKLLLPIFTISPCVKTGSKS